MDDEVLVDTNIFLEILLQQQRQQFCKSILQELEGRIILSDFSLHSIGVSMFRHKLSEAFLNFMKDLDGLLTVVELPSYAYGSMIEHHRNFNLDFDDAYQLALANLLGVPLITLDKDFLKVPAEHGVKVL